MRAARQFLLRLQSDGLLDPAARILAELYGSLALTGKGHGTDKAVLMGLEGDEPETLDPSGVEARVERIHAEKTLRLLGERPLAFDPEADLLFHKREQLPYHPNGMGFTAFDSAGGQLIHREYYSVGGGSVVNNDTAAKDRIVAD
ncbi:MAG: hypothetical protein MI919_21200, partial [Holophagales bacterium]|nr:hypothetical protein [Holophagales bacterium]